MELQTVYSLASGDDIAESHRLDSLFREVGQDPWPEVEFLGEIAPCPTVMAELKLDGNVITEVGVEDTQRVEPCNMVTAHLICTHQELDLNHVQRTPCGR
jgi:hypothetical protein